MKKKLFTFGCSYTRNFDGPVRHPNYVKYKEWRGGNLPLSWSQILSEKLDYDLVNYGIDAAGNQKIFRTFAKHAHEIQSGDMVIFQWSYMHRYDWVIPDQSDFETTGVGPLGKYSKIPNHLHEEMIMNRTKKPYYDEVYTFMNLINEFSISRGFELFFWSGDFFELIYGDDNVMRKFGKKVLCDFLAESKKEIFIKIFELGGQDITRETNNEIFDSHLGESGHKIKAELFYEHITKYRNEF